MFKCMQRGKICDATRCEATTERERDNSQTKRYDVKTVDCVMKLVIRRTTHTREYINVIELTRCV